MTQKLLDWACELCHYDENPQTASSCEACGYASTEDMPISEWLNNQGLDS